MGTVKSVQYSPWWQSHFTYKHIVFRFDPFAHPDGLPHRSQRAFFQTPASFRCAPATTQPIDAHRRLSPSAPAQKRPYGNAPPAHRRERGAQPRMVNVAARPCRRPDRPFGGRAARPSAGAGFAPGSSAPRRRHSPASSGAFSSSSGMSTSIEAISSSRPLSSIVLALPHAGQWRWNRSCSNSCPHFRHAERG